MVCLCFLTSKVGNEEWILKAEVMLSLIFFVALVLKAYAQNTESELKNTSTTVARLCHLCLHSNSNRTANTKWKTETFLLTALYS